MGGHQHTIVGREDEVARLRGALDAVRAGSPTVALVVGPPGIGKTALWQAAFAGGDPAGDGGEDRPEPLLITATGDEAEVDLAYGVVAQLLRRAPLDRATRALVAPAPGADAVDVGAGLLALVDRVELGRPLVVVVDDVQWADDLSLRALAFVVRRLRNDPVLLCLGCRDDAEHLLPSPLERLAGEGLRVELGPLDRRAVGDLAAGAYGRPLPAAAVARLHDHAGGNPLYVRALVDELPADTLARGDLSSLPVPRTYANLVIAQLAGCRDGARAMGAALAVLGRVARVDDVARVAGCGDPLVAVDELAARGLVEVRSAGGGLTVAFPHGLVRGVILGDMAHSRRAALHAAAAAVTAGADALAHRLAAATGPDDHLVALARAAADELFAAGAPARAARLLLTAAPMAASPDRRTHLVTLAAAQLTLAGEPVEDLVDDVAGFPESALRSYVLGRAAMTAGDLAGADRLFADAWAQASSAEADDDARAIAGPVADMLAVLALHRRQGGEIVTWARRSMAAGGGSGLAATLSCHGLALDGRFAEAEEEMSALLAGDPAPALRLDALLGRGVVRVWANDLDGAVADLEAVDAEEASSRPFLARVDARSFRAEAAFRAGRWPEALHLAESTASIVDDAGDPLLAALPHGVAAFVLAGMGRAAEAGAHVEAAMASAARTGLMPPRLWAAHAALRLAAAVDDYAAVARRGDALVSEGFGAIPEGIHHWRATYVEALVGVDRLDDAAAAAADLGDMVTPGGDVSVAADAARAAGLVAAARGRREEAARAFQAGLALDAVASRPYERGCLELAAGANLRRMGNRRAAATLLEQAARRFDALGAAPRAARCARELAACGLTPRRRAGDIDAGRELTAQERLVARLVAEGRTNREVAAELVISAKTVEHHLGRVYTKLGLRSRTELAARLAGGSPAGPA